LSSALSARERMGIRTSRVFVCFADPTFWTDPRAQAQVAYARQLGKPFRVLLLSGTRVPEDAFAGVEDIQMVRSRGVKADAAQLQVWRAEVAETD
jgi:hypothetical protein